MTITIAKEVEVKYLLAKCGVRYWEDATVDNVEDENGDLIPCRVGDIWNPLIDLHSGKIINWKEGVTADIHYKVRDAGEYLLLDKDKNQIVAIDGYVPDIMCPGDQGYGDYVIMKIDENGFIENWKPSFKEFEINQED